MRGAKAVAIQINSPGGSAVQSTLIYKRIRALAEEKNSRCYVFAEDVAASGGYLLALAGDEIYADPSSIVGSIGVITAGFGLDKLIEKIGVERRVYTAGDSKDKLDPFLPEKPEDVSRHQVAAARRARRPSSTSSRSAAAPRSQAPTSDLFTGEFWSGKRALELGLIDGLGDLRIKDARCFRRGRAPEAGAAVDLVVRAADGASSPKPAVSTSACHLAGSPPISSRRSRRARSGRASGFSHATDPSPRCRRSRTVLRQALVY